MTDLARCWTAGLTASLVLISAPASAQDIDKAIKAYNDDQYQDAAFEFFDVIENGTDPDARVKAEYYIAQSLYKAGLKLPAMQYYGEVFNSGSAHPYFLKATEGLLNVSQEIGDDTLIPELINQGYTQDFSKLRASVLNEINYMIGMITQRKRNFAEAKDFLEAVSDKSDLYIKARYLLAIMAVKTAADEQADDYASALKYFQDLEGRLEEKVLEDDKKLYRLSLLGMARTFYSQGDWKKSIEYYEKVPRFSDDWYDAMYEMGWAYFQNGEFGKALGAVHSIQSPYFDDRYRAESWVLKSTVYFQLCHFDRARKALDVFFRLYEPMSEGMRPWLEGEQTDEEMVKLIDEGDDKFPLKVRNQIRSNRRFNKFIGIVKIVEKETGLAEAQLPEGAFKAAVLELLSNQREQWLTLTGRLIRDQIRRESAFLEDFLNQARIIKFETADAERVALEKGFDITKGPRAKGPRPIVPNAHYQYWAFLGEYWIDELGYFEHSIKDECRSAGGEAE